MNRPAQHATIPAMRDTDTVVVDGVTYTGADLRAALAALPTPPAEQQALIALPASYQSSVLISGDEGCKVTFNFASGDEVDVEAWLIAVTEQAAPKAAPATQQAGELVSVPKTVFEKCEVALKRYSQAPTDYHNAVLRLRDSVRDLIAAAAPQQEAQKPCQTCTAMARTVMMDQVSFDRKPDCYGIRQITDDEGVEEWEDIRTSPDVAREEANDMMATGRGEIYEVVPLWTTPQHAPQPVPAPLSAREIELLKEARAAIWQPANAELCERIDAAIAAQGGKE